MERLPRQTPVLLLGLAMAVAAGVTLGFIWHTTFFADSWDLLMDRRDPSIDVLLTPHNEHLVMFPILINEVVLRVFGMDSGTPELILLVLFLCATAGLVYVFVERRVGAWPALFAAILLLFLGPAYEVLLWPFEIALIGPMLFGVAAILALDRPSTRNDVIACACISVGLGFSNLGVAFIAAGFVSVLLGPRDRWLSRAYIWVVPLALFAAWYIGWGHEAESHLGIHNILDAPAFVINTVAVGIGSMSGLGTAAGLVVDLTWSRIVALLVVIGVALWWRARHLVASRLDRALWTVLAAGLANWALAALNAFAGREPTSSRYQYESAIFVLLILACLFNGARPTRNWLIAGGVAVILAIGPNIVVLHEASKNYKREAVLTRADTAAIEIAQRTIDPNFELTAENAGTGALVNVYGGKYLEAVSEYGSPAYSEAELAGASPEGRHQADVVLFHALPISVTDRVGRYEKAAGADCVSVPPPEGEPREVRLSPGTTEIEVGPGDPANVSLRRFSGPGEFPVVTGGTPGESTVVLKIPRDESKRPWYVNVEAAQGARVCR
jgi:hypothetical protein